jgi:hypothetical protein
MSGKSILFGSIIFVLETIYTLATLNKSLLSFVLLYQQITKYKHTTICSAIVSVVDQFVDILVERFLLHYM